MSTDISNSANVIDSRDVIARIVELEGEREAIAEEWTNRAEYPDTTRANPELLTLVEWDEGDNGQDLKALKALAEEASGSPDWAYGLMTLINDSYFEDYARELAEDIGAIKGDESWPLSCIDWEKAARELQYDYFSVEYDGVTFWIRS